MGVVERITGYYGKVKDCVHCTYNVAVDLKSWEDWGRGLDTLANTANKLEKRCTNLMGIVVTLNYQ